MAYLKIAMSTILAGICSQAALAETATPLTTDKLSLVQDAVIVDANTVRLTPSAQAKAGFAFTPKICAREYILKFDLNAGNGSGAGFVLHKVREALVSPSYGPFRERRLEGLLPNGDLNFLFEIHPDTWRDPGQRDDNSLYAGRLDRNAYGTLVSVPLIDQTMPFRMKGSGWFTMKLHTVGDLIKLSVIKDGVVVLEKEALGSPSAGKSHLYSFYAWTGVAASEQQIANLSLEVIEDDDCRAPLTDDELTAELTSACGDGLTSCNQACYLATMQPLVTAGKITDLQMQRFLSLCSVNSCESEPTEPVDLTSIREQAFAEGVASVNLAVACEPIREQAYRAGVASVDPERIRKEAYAAGLKEGQKVTLCHKEKKKVNGVYKVVQNTLTVSISALKAHLAHGDTIGACPVPSKPAKK